MSREQEDAGEGQEKKNAVLSGGDRERHNESPQKQ